MRAITIQTPPATKIQLTGRQKLVLLLTRAGYSRREIADKLGLKNVANVSQIFTRAKAEERKLLDAFNMLAERP